MLDLLKRLKSLHPAFASHRIRRRPGESGLMDALEQGSLSRLLLFLLFIAGLFGLVFAGEHPGLLSSFVLMFQGENPELTKRFLVGVLIFLTAVTQLWINHGPIFSRNSRLALVLGVCFLHLSCVKFILALKSDGALDPNFARLILPYSFAPLVLSVLLGRNLGIFASIYVSLWGAMLLPQTFYADFLVLSLISGFMAVFLTLEVRRRNQLLRAGLWVGLATLILAFSLELIGPIRWGNLAATDWRFVATQSAVAVGNGMVIATLVGGILPLLESTFRLTTDMTWLELSDLNHPLLRRMTIEAPGTYHHSLVVANLAEAAAEAVGANPTLCRVCAYFHDIGKLVKPDYFSENIPPGQDPHANLSPTMSALIIIAHVKEGVDLALKHQLNKKILNVIQQHHGTSLVYYFYHRALTQQENARASTNITNIRAEDIPDVSEESFRYPGPRPQSKESGIVSLADAVESASRSLEKPTPQRIEQLVSEIIRTKVTDGQFDECQLTLRDLRKISESFRFTLQTMLHSRVAYPKRNPSSSSPSQIPPLRDPRDLRPLDPPRRDDEEDPRPPSAAIAG